MIFIIEETITIKEFLSKQNISKKAIKAIKMQGKILVNGQGKTVRYLLHQGDVLELQWPKEQTTMMPYDYPLKIVYEDEHYLIIDKPPNLPSIPTKRYPDKTLANALIYYYQQHHLEATVHLVNRLDKDTQGLMLVAKDRHSHYLLSKDIKQVKRVYHCLVEGRLEGQGTLTYSLSKDSDSVKRVVDEFGQRAITHYRSLKASDKESLIECILETGRTHQIRVHLATFGHPLIGDVMYGSLVKQDIYLKSVTLAFINPYTNELMEFRK